MITQEEADNILSTVEMSLRGHYKTPHGGNWILVWDAPEGRKIASSIKAKPDDEDRRNEAILMLVSALSFMWENKPTPRSTRTVQQ